MKEQSPILIVLFLFLRKGREDMKKIRSYTSIWSVEKVIYAINDLQLPFPITFTQMTWFIVSLFVVILFGSLPPLS
ncbi:TcpE family conjugal transfer membrane protein, partial [Staphylococcus aureus]